jgi:hypothetical protein
MPTVEGRLEQSSRLFVCAFAPYDTTMRTRGWRRSLAGGLALLLGACSHPSSTTSPSDPPVAIATGSQVLRVTFGSPCPGAGGGVLVGLVYTRVEVNRSGSEWIARSSGEGGTVEVRLHQTGASLVAGSMPIAGTVTGTAVHMPALLPGVPIDGRIDFGSDGRSTFTGFAFAPPFSATSGIDGLGSGTIVQSDSAGRSCSGSAFSLGMGATP